MPRPFVPTTLGQAAGPLEVHRVPQQPRLTRSRWLALGALAGGMFGVATTYLAYTGRQQAAAALAIAGGVVGAVVGAAQVLAITEAEQRAETLEVEETPILVVVRRDPTADPGPTTLSGLWW